VASNAALLRHGVAARLLEARTDIAWFGTETRPLRKFLSLARDPEVPTATGDARTAEALLLQLGIELQAEGKERCWSDLLEAERALLRGALVERLLATGLSARVPILFRQVVTLRREAPGRPTRELQEFATLLNSTARYGRAEIGFAVARGDRGESYGAAVGLLLDHRKHLVGALDSFTRSALTESPNLQWVHLQDRVLDTIVGIVCGMALDGLGLRRDRVLVGLAWTPDGRTKVSARAPRELMPRGIDLATALREAAAAVGGQGGGHLGAAGATIPRDREGDFLRQLDEALSAQLRGTVLVQVAPASRAAPASP
jgi:single-stranded-DNA-specific exonuclease